MDKDEMAKMKLTEEDVIKLSNYSDDRLWVKFSLGRTTVSLNPGL